MYVVSYMSTDQPLRHAYCESLDTKEILNAWSTDSFGMEYDEFIDKLFEEGNDIEADDFNVYSLEENDNYISILLHLDQPVEIIVVKAAIPPEDIGKFCQR